MSASNGSRAQHDSRLDPVRRLQAQKHSTQNRRIANVFAAVGSDHGNSLVPAPEPRIASRDRLRSHALNQRGGDNPTGARPEAGATAHA